MEGHRRNRPPDGVWSRRIACVQLRQDDPGAKGEREQGRLPSGWVRPRRAGSRSFPPLKTDPRGRTMAGNGKPPVASAKIVDGPSPSAGRASQGGVRKLLIGIRFEDLEIGDSSAAYPVGREDFPGVGLMPSERLLFGCGQRPDCPPIEGVLPSTSRDFPGVTSGCYGGREKTVKTWANQARGIAPKAAASRSIRQGPRGREKTAFPTIGEAVFGNLPAGC